MGVLRLISTNFPLTLVNSGEGPFVLVVLRVWMDRLWTKPVL